MSTNDALDTAENFLGPNYVHKGEGRFVSEDGTRQVRMTNEDLAKVNNHAGAPHMNFEEGKTIVKPNGKESFVPDKGKNSHIFFAGGKMRARLNENLRQVSNLLDVIRDDILSENPCRAFAALRLCDEGRSVKLSGNTEGLIYFASVLLGLAENQKPGSHHHFGKDSMLDEADRELILQFELAEWD